MNFWVNIEAVSARWLAAVKILMRFFLTNWRPTKWLSIELWCFVFIQFRCVNAVLLLLFQLRRILRDTHIFFFIHLLVASIRRWTILSSRLLGDDLILSFGTFLYNFSLISDSGPNMRRPMLTVILHELAVSCYCFGRDGRRALSVTVQIWLDASLLFLFLAEGPWCWWYRLNFISVILFLL